MSISPGFDYKEIQNTVLGVVISEDHMRVAKIGVDLDFSDRLNGRNIITQEFDMGIKDIFGGLARKDPGASRVGSGGEFFKMVTNAARIQSLPWDTTLMVKGSMQLTAYNLTSTEQFNIGGPTSVRGYPVAEYAGDSGGTASAEFYVPPYFIPKEWTVPFSDTSFYDAIRILGFFDWGYVTTKTTQIGESGNETLFSAGPALRFDVPGKMSLSLDWGFGLGQQGSDGIKNRGYVEVKVFI